MPEASTHSSTEPICGMDEVGRGALAGPLVAAAVVLDPDFRHPWLKDSKLLSPAQREHMNALVREAALSLALVALPVELIDRRGIGWANRVAFERLVRAVAAPRHLADGNLRIRAGASYQSVIGGDGSVPAISAASIVAKVFRDGLMCRLAQSYPGYGWTQNKGYGTPFHLSALRELGPCGHHRLSFLHLEQGELPFAAAD